MKNVFYFISKALLVLEIFTFLTWLFGYVEKWLEEKAMTNFKIHDVTGTYCPTSEEVKGTRQ